MSNDNSVNQNNPQVKTIEIWTDTSDESMVGGAGWETFDPGASVDEFVDLVIEAVQREYPDYSIVLHQTNHRNEIVITDERDEIEHRKDIEDDQDNIREIISTVWQGQDWYIENDDIDDDDDPPTGAGGGASGPISDEAMLVLHDIAEGESTGDPEEYREWDSMVSQEQRIIQAELEPHYVTFITIPVDDGKRAMSFWIVTPAGLDLLREPHAAPRGTPAPRDYEALCIELIAKATNPDSVFETGRFIGYITEHARQLHKKEAIYYRSTENKTDWHDRLEHTIDILEVVNKYLTLPNPADAQPTPPAVAATHPDPRIAAILDAGPQLTATAQPEAARAGAKRVGVLDNLGWNELKVGEKYWYSGDDEHPVTIARINRYSKGALKGGIKSISVVYADGEKEVVDGGMFYLERPGYMDGAK
jgi:hypothetical protein